jgi:L-asparaginase II
MSKPVDLIEIWRGDMIECLHQGHAVVCDDAGKIVRAWGDPEAIIFPRSSCKMLQALPLVESGAADAFGLTEKQLALSCASHDGSYIHTDAVSAWVSDLGLGESDFRCGPQVPGDVDVRDALIRANEQPCRIHNNCSGKHCGFLTLNKHMGAGPDYTKIDHPVQQTCKAVFEETTQETSPTYGIDGCSAPNFATSVHGLARSMAFFASAHTRGDTRSTAAARLTEAMMAYPEMVAGEARACTKLMRAMDGKVAVKTGAEGVFIAIIPEKRLGVALKITDGATRASEAAIAAILVKLGVLDAAHPTAKSLMATDIRNWDGLVTGRIQPTVALT